MAGYVCRFCNAPLHQTFVDLGTSPLSNAFLRADNLEGMEPFYPLHVYICSSCYLVQLMEFESPERIFGDYAYFSSYSDSWLRHAQNYAQRAVESYHLDADSLVIEVASNDGYLLRCFREYQIPVLGIEPARNVAEVAQAASVPTLVKFFGVATAKSLVDEGQQADLLVGNNVLGHVPDINDFVAGLKIVLKPNGVITIEFPHLLRLMRENQFDTIYHEHFSYWSLLTVEKVFAAHGLRVFNVEEIPTHGGSLRVYARHVEQDEIPVTDRVDALRAEELKAGLNNLSTYASFTEQVHATKRNLLEFLINARRNGKKVVGYGAPAKGNTLLNYCGIRTDFLEYTVDRSPHKYDHFLPGTRIPVYHPDKIREDKPDYVLILAWNLREEITEQMSYIREWGGQFVVPIPEVKVLE